MLLADHLELQADTVINTDDTAVSVMAKTIKQ